MKKLKDIMKEMKKNIFTATFTLCMLTILFLPSQLFAAGTPFYSQFFGVICDDPAKIYNCWIREAWAWSTYLLFFLCPVVLIAAGYIYMTSQGNPDRISVAHKLVAGVFSGLGLLIFAYFLIHQVIGIDVSIVPNLNVW